MMSVQLVLLLVILVFYLFLSYHGMREESAAHLNNLMKIYGSELDNKINNADRLLERLVYNNTDYDMLQSNKETERYYAAINLRKLLDDAALDSDIDAAVVAESRYQTYVAKENVYMSLKQRQALKEFTMAWATAGDIKTQWRIKPIGINTYLFKIYLWQGKATGIFISLDNFMDIAARGGFGETTFLLTDANEQVWGFYGRDVTAAEPGIRLAKLRAGWAQESSYDIAAGQVRLYSVIGFRESLSRISFNVLVMFFIILVSLLFAIGLVRYIQKEIINPMRNMKDNMERIGRQNGARDDAGDDAHIVTEYDNDEFTVLRETFNRLMDEIIDLKIKSYEKKLALQETELKCVRLQIRPHFFLNAMTTISSLSMRQRNEEIQKYIEALSQNIRYMFKSGLHTVPLIEEIAHAENYFAMQELKYPDCVFYSIELEPGTEQWPLPQMIIHTIIENEYKYAVALEGVLTILLRAKQITEAGEEFLLLEIEDDGKGYPPEVLRRFESTDGEGTDSETADGKGIDGQGIDGKGIGGQSIDGRDSVADGRRIGLWSLKRMIELMYEGAGRFQIANLDGGGCVNRFRIPRQAAQEVVYENSFIGY